MLNYIMQLDVLFNELYIYIIDRIVLSFEISLYELFYALKLI
jgi:hypothetical protein